MSEGMEYYFISFMYGASDKRPENSVTDEHPLAWQKRVNKRYPGQYKLTSWKEISAEEYEEYKDYIG